METDSAAYQERLTIFLDILGWREFIVRSLTDDRLRLTITRCMQTLAGDVRRLDSVTAKGFKITTSAGGGSNIVPDAYDFRIVQFSDCIVISARPEKYALFQATGEIRRFCGNLLLQGFLVRGGMTIGPLCHSDDGICGPALVRAYELESRMAVYPRIVVDPELSLPEEIVCRPNCDFYRLDDDLVFIDYLRPKRGMRADLENPVPVPDILGTEHLPALREIIEGSLERFRGEHGIFRKYRWLAGYFNTLVDESRS